MPESRLEELRRAKHLRQQDLANAIAVSRSAIASWEAGTRSPDAVSAAKLARFLGTTSEYILGLVDDPRPLPTEMEFQMAHFLSASGLGSLASSLPRNRALQDLLVEISDLSDNEAEAVRHIVVELKAVARPDRRAAKSRSEENKPQS